MTPPDRPSRAEQAIGDAEKAAAKGPSVAYAQACGLIAIAEALLEINRTLKGEKP